MYKNEYKYDTWKRSQHEAVRNSVGWYLYTHQLLEVTGTDATAFLDKLYVMPIATLKIGGARYTTMLNEDGIIIDDVIVFRLEDNKYWISTLYANKLMTWFDDHMGSNDVQYEHITKDISMFAVQGPKSRDLMNSILAEKLDDQKFFTIRDNKIDNIPVRISRAGYTGEMGFEIYVASESKDLIVAKLKAASKAFGAVEVTEFQVQVLTLATEKGFSLMSDLEGTTPFESDFDAGIDWNRDFNGKKALEKLKSQEPKRKLLGFEVDNDDNHIVSKDKSGPGEAVMINGKEVGRVTKYTYGFTIGKSIGFALVDNQMAKIGDRVKINDYDATLTSKTWYDTESKRIFGR